MIAQAFYSSATATDDFILFLVRAYHLFIAVGMQENLKKYNKTKMLLKCIAY